MNKIITRPALRYYGGKWNSAPWIISHFPKHNNYVEPCGGAASMLFQKRPVKLETYNDLDGNIVNFFRVLRNNPDELIRLIHLTPYAREEFEYCNNPDGDNPIENARRFYISCWFAISCLPFAHTGMRTDSYAGQTFVTVIKSFRNQELILYTIAEKLRYVQIENRSYDYVIPRYDHPTTLFYLDPPYVHSTRSSGYKYTYDWDEEEHRKLAELLKQIKGFVVVSGYACELYTELYEKADWKRFDKEFQVNIGKRTESLWLSPRIVEALKLPEQQKLF